MQIYVNGSQTEVGESLTIEALVTNRGLNPETVVIEHNLAIQPREKWSEITISAGDKIEIVAFVGGG